MSPSLGLLAASVPSLPLAPLTWIVNDIGTPASVRAERMQSACSSVMSPDSTSPAKASGTWSVNHACEWAPAAVLPCADRLALMHSCAKAPAQLPTTSAPARASPAPQRVIERVDMCPPGTRLRRAVTRRHPWWRDAARASGVFPTVADARFARITMSVSALRDLSSAAARLLESVAQQPEPLELGLADGGRLFQLVEEGVVDRREV